MLSKWLKGKPKLTDADPARRLAAVRALDAAEQPTLLALARDDADAAVRNAALDRLAAAHLGALLQEAEARQDRPTALDLAGRLAALDDDHAFANHPLIAVARCIEAPSATALAAIGDAELHALAITRVRDVESRAALADTVWRAERLTALEALVRNKDKTLHRLAKERLGTLRRLREKRANLTNRAESLVAAAERLAPTEPQFAARRDALSQEWEGLWSELDANAAALGPFGHPAEPDTALRQRFRLPEAPPAHAQPEASGHLLAELEALEGELLAALDDIDDGAAMAERLADLDGRWREAERDGAPAPAAAASYSTLGERLHGVLDALQRSHARRLPAMDILALNTTWQEPKKDEDYAALWRAQSAWRHALKDRSAIIEAVAWPEHSSAPKWLAELAAKADALHAMDERCQVLFAALKQEIDDSIDAMEAHVEAGEVAEASRRQAQAGRCIRRLPKAAQDAPAAQLASRSGRLKELNAWQAFAERGKREALCDEMDALAADPLPPPAQAERIKALRKRVQALGRIRSGQDRVLMERFDAAAERAFAPCRQHFEALAETRRFNLTQRETICQELETFVEGNDWANADYRGVAQILRAAREQWRTYHPVDSGPGKRLEARFKAVTDALHQHVKADWGRNVAAKEAIIETAQAAVAADRPVADLVELMKRLQREWREVGPTPRRKDQQLWKSFRAICDHVFSARDSDRAARRSQASSAVAQANALVEDLLAAASEDATQMPDRRMLRDFEARADALEELPREVEKRVQRALADFGREVALTVGRRRVQDEVEHIERMASLDAALARIEREGDATHAWEQDAGALKAAFAPRLEGAAAADADALRKLAIEAEVAAEIESPAEDQALRMALRMDRLRDGLGNRDRADGAELLERWCASAAHQTGAEAVRERFFAALRRMAQR